VATATATTTTTIARHNHSHNYTSTTTSTTATTNLTFKSEPKIAVRLARKKDTQKERSKKITPGNAFQIEEDFPQVRTLAPSTQSNTRRQELPRADWTSQSKSEANLNVGPHVNKEFGRFDVAPHRLHIRNVAALHDVIAQPRQPCKVTSPNKSACTN
jgi:hypothetical protein